MVDLWNAPMRNTPLSTHVRIPGSKSLTNRWLVLASLAAGTCRITHPLVARDTRLMAAALSSLGVGIEYSDDAYVVTPGTLCGPAEIDCGLAGTVMRFVPPVAALATGDVRFDGDTGARTRPMHRIIEALKSLEVDVDDELRGTLPFTVHGKGYVAGSKVTLDASASSQFVSALLLAGSRYDGGLEVEHKGGVLPSMPHIDMTIEVLASVGIQVATQIIDERHAIWRVYPGIPNAFNVTVEPDLSNAAPFVAAALVCGGSVTIPDWPLRTTQAGDALRSLLTQMGATVTRSGNDVTFTGGQLHGLTADLHEVGELTPVIAALCALAQGPSHLSGIAHLRGHETDRISALATEINRLGGEVTETADGLIINPQPLHGGSFATYHDHRMAMAGAVLGLAVPNLQIEDIATTGKTLPDFDVMWHVMVNA
ncbi:MAG: 3-phosphoshikimate 1-carboxyvinyltransferase [Actinobacteria bacterium]|nr:3-phosphoshikimate 1-carboxyvinyltransferase [Actinomycetota bacterium]NBY14986.1 3-phosphoshikimate 1-carboxyvinyltransferase [Actinomycetota bacterium]